MDFKHDKHIIIPIILGFVALIGYRSWHDMHPPPPQKGHAIGAYDLVRDQASFTALASDKDNDHVFVVWAGSFKQDADKKIVFTPSPIAPANVAQREIVLFYTLYDIPADATEGAEEMGPAIEKAAEAWKDQGDLINDIYLDPGPAGAKTEQVLALLNPLRDAMHKNYWLGVVLSRAALESLPDAQKQVAEIQKSSRMIIFDAKNSLKPKETLAEMIAELEKRNLDMAFMVRVDEMPDLKALTEDIGKRLNGGRTKNFLGLMFDTEKMRQAAQ